MADQEVNRVDRFLLVVTLAILGFGLIMVFSAGFIVAEETWGDPYHFLKRQALWAALGLTGMFLMAVVHYHKLRRFSIIFLLANFILLGMIYSGFGSDLGTEARRWLVFGPVILQPAEFSKLALVIFSAAFMSSRRLNFKNIVNGSLLPLALAALTFALIQLQPDLGTALVVLVGSALVVVFAGMPFYQIAGLSLAFTPVLAYLTLRQEYRVQRLFTFIDPWAEPTGAGYQVIQSFYALGPGYIFGSGLGRSMQKLFYLPEPQNDFIFAIIGEELGFIGTASLLLLYLVIIWRGCRIALRAPDLFGTLLAAGITFMFAVQVIINVSVVTGTIPVTGITLPLVSYGGSSIFFTLLGIGILLNISRYSLELKPAAGGEKR